MTALLTGLPSAGKSTIASGVAQRLRSASRRVQVLDGDHMRRNLTADLGFTKEDREENVRRIGFVATLLAAHGVITLVPVIAPYAASRNQVRTLHAAQDIDFVEVYVATPVGVCANRDVKGLYAQQRAGLLHGLTGMDDPYEAPANGELVLHTHTQQIDESVDAVFTYLLPWIEQ